MLVLTWCRLSLFTPGGTPGSQEHANKSPNCLRFELSIVERFFIAARSETSPPRVWQSVRLWAPPTCPGMKNTLEKTCKQSAIIMCTLNGDMINLISGRPANNARKCLVTFFFFPQSNQHVPALGIGTEKNFRQEFYPICKVYHVTATVFNSDAWRLLLLWLLCFFCTSQAWPLCILSELDIEFKSLIGCNKTTQSLLC